MASRADVGASHDPGKGEMSLQELLDDSLIESPKNGNRYFIPCSIFKNQAFSHQNVKTILLHQNHLPNNELETYTNKILESRKRIFTILLIGLFTKPEAKNSIWRFVDEGVTDDDLPFVRYYQGNKFMLCSKHHNETDGHPCVGKVMNDWIQKDISEFCRLQWAVQAAVFRKEHGHGGLVPHYDFDYNKVLPFVESFKGDKRFSYQGGYSLVWPVRIAAGHQNLYFSRNKTKNPEPQIAIKQLFSQDEQDFKQETEMLAALTRLKHNHLVDLLATYKHEDKYHLLFPYAKANLRSLWTSISAPNRNTTTYRWVLDQMSGVASALNVIHQYQSNFAYSREGHPGWTRFKTEGRMKIIVETGQEKFGRHGDLKPENILWRDDLPQYNSAGILQITDLGLGRFHHLDSRSRVDPAKVTGSQTYMPPELPLNRAVSRKYDMWSLGCVFLEFTVWLLTGSAGLEEFNNSRVQESYDGVDDDTYYTIIPTSDGRAESAVVRAEVSECIRRLRNNPRCSKALEKVLDLLENGLLRVDPRDRISAFDLYNELKNILTTSHNNSSFLVGSRPTDELIGFKMPSDLSVRRNG